MNGLRMFWVAAAALMLAAVVLALRPPVQSSRITESEPSSSPAPQEVAESDPVPATAPVAPPPTTPSPAPPPEKPRDQKAEAVPSLGRGTEIEPFRINWDLLALGRDAVRDDGSLALPPGLQAVDGTWIEIDAYYAAPLAVESTRELLVMLNRWDGCCIGVPPTAFDCIETTLAEPLELRGRHQIRFGPVRGVLRIEPFRIGDLLLGLYRLEQASLRNG